MLKFYERQFASKDFVHKFITNYNKSTGNHHGAPDL